jgi:hypothetical protein
MTLNLESLSNQEKAAFLASLAYHLTICARDTYEPGTDRVLHPELLRAYNELQHRVTANLMHRLSAANAYPLQNTLELLQSFGEQNGRTGDMQFAWRQAVKSVRQTPS